MRPKDRHGGIARVTIEDRECYWMRKAGVVLRVFTEFAEFAIGHTSDLADSAYGDAT